MKAKIVGRHDHVRIWSNKFGSRDHLGIWENNRFRFIKLGNDGRVWRRYTDDKIGPETFYNLPIILQDPRYEKQFLNQSFSMKPVFLKREIRGLNGSRTTSLSRAINDLILRTQGFHHWSELMEVLGMRYLKEFSCPSFGYQQGFPFWLGAIAQLQH